MEANEFEQKLNDLSKTAYEIKALSSEYQAHALHTKRQAEENLLKAQGAQKEYEKILKQIGDYWTEFDKKKQEEHSKLENEKKQSKQQMLDAELKLSVASKKLAEVEAQEKVLEGKLKEVEALKSYLEQEKEKVKAFIQSFK
jgi:hypothetical protein